MGFKLNVGDFYLVFTTCFNLRVTNSSSQSDFCHLDSSIFPRNHPSKNYG